MKEKSKNSKDQVKEKEIGKQKIQEACNDQHKDK